MNDHKTNIKTARVNTFGLGALALSALIAMSSLGYNMAIANQKFLKSSEQISSLAVETKAVELNDTNLKKSNPNAARPASAEPEIASGELAEPETIAPPLNRPQSRRAEGRASDSPALGQNQAQNPTERAEDPPETQAPPLLSDQITGVTPSDPDIVVLQIEPNPILDAIKAELTRNEESVQSPVVEPAPTSSPIQESGQAEASEPEATNEENANEQVVASSLPQPSVVQDLPQAAPARNRNGGETQPNVVDGSNRRRRGSGDEARPQRRNGNRGGQGRPPRPGR